VTDEHEQYDSELARFEERLAASASAHFSLLLFITGTSDLSMRAIRNVRSVCEGHLADRYDLKVIDVNRNSSLMSSYDIVAAPTLIKISPAPHRMLVGDLSNTARVLKALDIPASEESRGGLDR
jgi:circadian clock protein KaiB